MFEHDKRYEPLNLQTIESDAGRRYITPSENKYESITTALGKNWQKQQQLAKWRAAVGEEEANRVSRVASSRGTSLHLIAERYLDNESNPTRGAMPTAISVFNKAKAGLDSNINKVYMQEFCLYSDVFELAGRCDALVEWNGKFTILDFKTSKKTKKREWIQDYFLQCAAYSFMFEEMYGVKIENNVIFIAGDVEVQIFESDPVDYLLDPFFTKRIK